MYVRISTNQSIKLGKLWSYTEKAYNLRSDTNSPNNWRVEEILYGARDEPKPAWHVRMPLDASRDDLSGHLLFGSLRFVLIVVRAMCYFFFLIT